MSTRLSYLSLAQLEGFGLHGFEINFGQAEDGWRVRFREAQEPDRPTMPADPMEMLIISEAPRQIRVGQQVIEEHLGDAAFRLLKFLADHKGNWYPTTYLIDLLWSDAEEAPLSAPAALSHRKKDINDLLGPSLRGQDAIESQPYRGYRMKSRLDD